MAHHDKPFGPGIRFSPSNQQIVSYFLQRWIRGEPALDFRYPHIYEVDPYSNHPSSVFGCLGVIDSDEEDTARYLYTRLMRKGKGSASNSKNCKRTVDNYGVWKNQRTDTIYDDNNEVVIGYKKLFTFIPNDRNRSDNDIKWVMHEFSTANPTESDRVLCKIKRKFSNKENTRKKRSRGQQHPISTVTTPDYQQGDADVDQEWSPEFEQELDNMLQEANIIS